MTQKVRLIAIPPESNNLEATFPASSVSLPMTSRRGGPCVVRTRRPRCTWRIAVLTCMAVFASCQTYPHDQARLIIQNMTDLSVVDLRVRPAGTEYSDNLLESPIPSGAEVEELICLGIYTILVVFDDQSYLEQPDVDLSTVGTYILQVTQGG